MHTATEEAVDGLNVGMPVEGGQQPRRFRVLALSGGGFRGLYTAKILADIEQHLGEPIATRFELLAGTSIGGILALALAMEIPAERMVTLFEEHGEDIFRLRFSWFGLARSPYTQDALLSLLKSDSLFGEHLVGHCRHPLIVPSINYSSGMPVLFKTPHHPNFSRDHHHRATDVALATSAAPGYFPRHTFGSCQYIDGGLYANAPGLLAVHEAQHFLGASRDQIHVVSIGTMSSRFTVNPSRNREGGTFDWGGINPANMPKRLFGIAISAQESLADQMLRHRVVQGQYFHIDDELTDERSRAVALDKADKNAREVLLGAGSEASKRALGSPEFRELLSHRASLPVFYHGPNKNA
jgi:patatin-like phospholipase/acyl hydrolase